MSRVVVVIVGFRCAEDIVCCLQKLAGSTGPAFEVQICENGGEASFQVLLDALAEAGAGTAQFEAAKAGAVRRTALVRGIGGFPIKVHCASGNLGYAGGINAVLNSIADEPDWHAIWVLNPDTEPANDALAELERHAGRRNYGIVGSRMVLTHSGTIQMYGGIWRRWIAKGWNIGLGKAASFVPDVEAVERDMDYVSGASMYVTRDFIRTVGIMDERYFLYAEEVDWCFRRGDFLLGYAHQSVVYHAHGATIGSNHDRRSRSAFSVFFDERSRLLFTRRFFPKMLPFIAFSTLAVVTQQYLLAGAFRNYGAALAGWLDGLLGRTGLPKRFLPPSSHV